MEKKYIYRESVSTGKDRKEFYIEFFVFFDV